MAKCAKCKNQETGMYENGVPICLACATDKAAKIKSAVRATANSMDGTSSDLQENLERSG